MIDRSGLTRVIRNVSQDCYWQDGAGNRFEATPEENAAVVELLATWRAEDEARMDKARVLLEEGHYANPPEVIPLPIEKPEKSDVPKQSWFALAQYQDKKRFYIGTVWTERAEGEEAARKALDTLMSETFPTMPEILSVQRGQVVVMGY